MRARTMVYLDPAQHRALKAEARRLGISLAELMRRLVSEHLEKREGLPAVPKSAYLKIIGLGASGRGDISERHDAYLAEALRREHAG